MNNAVKKKKYIGFNADADVMEYLRKQNALVYKETGRTNMSASINMLIRKGAEASGWKK